MKRFLYYFFTLMLIQKSYSANRDNNSYFTFCRVLSPSPYYPPSDQFVTIHKREKNQNGQWPELIPEKNTKKNPCCSINGIIYFLRKIGLMKEDKKQGY